jgi:hypothetical protein
MNIVLPCYAGSSRAFSSLSLKCLAYYRTFLNVSIPEHQLTLYDADPT